MTRGATNTAVQGIGRHDRARTQQAGLNDTTLTKTPVQAPIQHRISERYMPLNHARPGQRLGIRPSSMAKDTGVDTTVIALWLGHEDVRSTQIYLHADLTIKERALART